MPESAPSPARADFQTRFKPANKAGGRKSAITDILKMQDVLKARCLDMKTGPKEQSSCALAWERLEERKRILRGKPLPGSLRQEPVKSSRRRAQILVPPSEKAA